MKYLFFILFPGLFVSFIYCNKAKSELITPQSVDTTLVNGWYTPAQYQLLQGVGMDVDWAKTASGIAAYKEKAVIDMKERGISLVRIRVANDMSASLLDHIDVIINDCLKHNLLPVIAYQADAFKNDPNNEGLLEAAINWWGAVASRFRFYSPRLSFNLMIECSDDLNNNNRRLNDYMDKTMAKVRETNPKRIVFISPRKLSHPDYLKELAIPATHNGFVMAETHFYAAGPSKTNANKLWTTGTAAEKKLITNLVDTAYAWQTRMKIPVWIGAWMPSDYEGTDNSGFTSGYSISEQEVFATFVSCTLSKKKIPYAVNSDTKYYNRSNNSWFAEMTPVVDAFLNPACP